jgi:alpha-methylacyl-CoA racemase
MPDASAEPANGAARPGPLAGLRVVEFAGLGPAPFATMLLADLGAEVVRVERPPGPGRFAPVPSRFDLLARSRRSVALDLRQPAAVRAALELTARADVLIEGFRPGVMERLGLGPDDCWASNPALVYGRMTGWGQDGPWAAMAGHDIGYIAITGALAAIGRTDGPPQVPVNLVGDFGGGAVYLAFGVLAPLWEAQRSGRGQVVDASVVDGTASLATMLHGLRAGGVWQDTRGTNLLDTGYPSYDVYRTADDRWIAVGALEPQFWAEFCRIVGLTEDESRRDDPAQWPALRERVAAAVATRTRTEWADAFAGTDACVAPVLTFAEAPEHPQLAARGTFVEVDGVVQPAPAPRFSRTPTADPSPPPEPGSDTRAVLTEWGVTGVADLLASGAATQTS